MRRTLILLSTLILLISTIPMVFSEVQFDTLTLEAKNVDCAKCHPGSPHTLHEEVMKQNKVTCEACHGAALEIAIPQCEKCHGGTIHDAHIAKVKTEDCSYCHGDINTHHNREILDTTVCAHCHRDLVDVHSGCEACHKTAPDIVKPVQHAGVTILCQDCHAYDDLVHLHGEETDTSICYMCHRPEGNTEKRELKPDVIPHLIHLPDLATCDGCHMPEGKVILPPCSNCHDLTGLHLITVVPPTQRGLDCSVCHPESSATAALKPTATPVMATPDGVTAAVTPESIETAETAEEGDAVPGFGVVLLAVAGTVAYIVRRMR
jgi:hypothetical protein